MKLTEVMAELFVQLNVSKTDVAKACAVVLTSIAVDSEQSLEIKSTDGSVVYVDISEFEQLKDQ